MRVAIALVTLATLTACTDRGSDIAVIYRGDVAAYRTLVHVLVDAGAKARDLTPAFPSGGHAEKVATDGRLPVDVVVLTAARDTAARYTLPPLQLKPNTAYRVGIVIGRRPATGRCDGAWIATPLERSLNAPTSSGARAESLYVSVSLSDRAKPPRCED